MTARVADFPKSLRGRANKAAIPKGSTDGRSLAAMPGLPASTKGFVTRGATMIERPDYYTEEQWQHYLEKRKDKPARKARNGNGHDTRGQTEITVTYAKEISPEPIDWLWQGWLAKRKLHLIAGAPEPGKRQSGFPLPPLSRPETIGRTARAHRPEKSLFGRPRTALRIRSYRAL
jgi:hypothetical protein